MPVYRFKGSKPGRPKFASIETSDINGVERIVTLDATIELSTAQFADLSNYAILEESDTSDVTSVETGQRTTITITLPADVVPQEGDVVTFTNGNWGVTQP